MKATKFDDLISDFYAVESMYWTLKNQVLRMRFPEFYGIPDHVGQRYPLNISVSRFVKELGEWRDATHPAWARMLRDSLLGMAIGEARHATAWDRYSGNLFLNRQLLNASESRQSVYDKLFTFSVEDCSVLEKLFDCEGWVDSFGGEAWADVVRYAARYGSVDDTTFIDTVVHAVHNGGCAFDKGLLVMVNSSSQVSIILDQKRDASVLDLNYLKVSERVHKWIRQYKNINRQLGFDVKIPSEISTHFGVKVGAIGWAEDPTLEIDEDPTRQNGQEYCGDCDSYDCCCNPSVGGPAFEEVPNNMFHKEGYYDLKKSKKTEQEQAKKLGKDFDYVPAKICNAMSLR